MKKSKTKSKTNSYSGYYKKRDGRVSSATPRIQPKDLQDSTVERAALGRIAKIGDLYDARADSFTGLSILKGSVPTASLTMRDNHFSHYNFTVTDSFEDKFSNLEVKAELKCPVREDRTLYYNIKTVKEQLNVLHKDLADVLLLEAIMDNNSATHVIIGIEWGANFCVSAEAVNNDKKNVKEIEGCLKAEMEIISASFSGAGLGVSKEITNSENRNVSIKFYGDILPDGDLPQTIEDAQQLMKKVKSLVASVNSGRGKPIIYTMLPLSLIRHYFKLKATADVELHRLDDDIIQKHVHVFDEIAYSRQILNDLHRDLVENQFCLSAEHAEKVMTKQKELDIAESKFKAS
ncbi:verrucotoxin subunit beta-like [Paramacrobiotus metropolitanus]|uniref:verrucotoxin subunit beta-like n=1 Tax=Paramacrobiotus metropolitanus TaxID=2943436 RepID=UPI002446290C|nr:verrucotoxin subunit beta-like [Paramacrobiotus metropolitanus]